MSIILSDFHLSNHSFFSQGLGIDFVMCKLKKFIVKACPSDRICLVLPILGTGEKPWPCCQLLRGLFPSRSWVHDLYSPVHACWSLSPSLQQDTRQTFQFYFLWLHWEKQGEQRLWCLRYFLFCVGAQRLQQLFVVIPTVWLPADGETRRWLLNQDIPPEALGNFFICLLSVLKDCKSIFTGKRCREQRLMFF